MVLYISIQSGLFYRSEVDLIEKGRGIFLKPEFDYKYWH